MIRKSEKVFICLFFLAFLAAIGLTIHLRIVQDRPGLVSLSNYPNSGNLPYIENGLVNINIASSQQLQLVPGIGEGLSKRIVADRNSNGPFSSVEDVMRVKGIGQKTYDKIKSFITTGGHP